MTCKRGDVVTGLSQTVVAMITSNLGRAGHRSRVEVRLNTAAGRRSGLVSDSVIMTDNLVTVLDSEIDKAIGVWTDMPQVDKALRFTFGL